MKKYIPQEIEQKWQKKWDEESLYSFKEDEKKQKYYTLVELPYPSGDLHTGHWFTWATPDAISRYRRMKGMNVFFRHGYDAFGLPAENAAIKRGVHPKDWTYSNIESMTRQFKTMGSMIDWSKVTVTCDPQYYRWNQWIFIEMYKRGLAYRSKTLSNWCESCQTVLANENVENGNCWRCGNPVVQKEVAQWFLKITEYADRLEWSEKPSVDWPDSVRIGQNNWIGKSSGAEIVFTVSDSELNVKVFTTRPDTIYGATALVLAPEHSALTHLQKEGKLVNDKNVQAYIEKTKSKNEEERKMNKEKTGVFTGVYAVNPVNGEKVPVWIADYVLSSYGHGAIMLVPAHDERDFAFAKQFGIEIKQVIESEEMPFVGEGTVMNSGNFDGLKTKECKEKVIELLEKNNWGTRQVQYHIHDWSISRQRYWGTPVPMIHCEACGIVPVPETDLPVELPYEVDFTPKGKPPLATNEDWIKTTCPTCGRPAERDVETLDTFFDSSWYYYRYPNPDDTQAVFDKALVEKLLPVDIYFGGAEHTLGHTLYARFFTKFFKDLGLVSFDEFAHKRVQHGIVLGTDGNKMSKSKGNVVNPDDVVKEYGADTTRLYLCFMMPYDGTSPWSTDTIAGVYRFVNRVWNLQEKVKEGVDLSKEDEYEMYRTLEKVGRDLEQIKCNTAVAAIMEWLNYLSRREHVTWFEYRMLITILAPFAPHMTEELWREFLKEEGSVHTTEWPKVDAQALKTSEISIPVQVNGKVRGIVSIQADEANEENVVKKALEDEKIKKFITNEDYRVVYVKGKILNIIG